MPAISPTDSIAPSQVDASTDYTGFHAFIDKTDATYFAFTLDSITNPTGSVGFGVHGVGMVDIAAPTFGIPDPHSMTIQYECQATLETDAKIDLYI